MHSKWLGRIGLTALVAGIVGTSGGMVGCAAERDPIDRVQLGALPKAFFLGQDFSDPADDPEFYARTMVVDVPYGESGSSFLMFTNTINSVSKIKWSIEGQEGFGTHFLTGRVSFERIDNTDGRGLPADERDPLRPLAQNDGLVVYQFRIVSQFDIRRAYNPQTGEESNVIEENTIDRPWHEREYMRVDFTENLVTTAYDFDTLSLLGVYNGIQWTSRPFSIQDPNSPHKPVIDLDEGYFDVTNVAFAAPRMLKLWGMEFPGCLLPNVIRGGTAPVGNCNPNEITLRHSFKRVVDTDYEPIDWDGKRFETYGAFLEERNGYARDYGPADKLWRRYIARYNIWERSHHYTDPENMTGATACIYDEDCAGIGEVPGMSHCDTAKSKCTLPYMDRKPKPIVWHHSDGSNPEYFEPSREAGEEWDAAMRVAVMAAKYAECNRYMPGECGIVLDGNFAEEDDAMYLVKEQLACQRGEIPNVPVSECHEHIENVAAERGYSPAVLAVAEHPQMIYMCHSPVAETDPEICGKPGTVARLGDLRYHLVTDVATPQTNSPWGIMSDANDPVTGEHIAASVNVWTHVNDLYARGIVDTVRYIGGELSTQDVTDGKNVNQWIEAAKRMDGVGMSKVMSKTEIDSRIASAAGTTVEKLRTARKVAASSPLNSGTKNAQLRQALIANMQQVADTQAAIGAPSHNAPIYEARRQMLAGSPVEAAVATPAMQQLAGAGFSAMGGDDGKAGAFPMAATSVLQGLNPGMQRQLEQQLELSLAARGSCVMHYEATAPLGYLALSDVLQQKFGAFNPKDSPAVQHERAERMKKWLKLRAQYNVMSHEMGHSFALRHNFVSSSDGWNYRPQYWQLRTNDKKAIATNKVRDDGRLVCDPSYDPESANGAPNPKTCVGPRWEDSVTPNESKNLIQMWMQSSMMDYAGEPTQNLLGLGAYDFGAARMFYGDVTTVYQDARFKKGARGKGPGAPSPGDTAIAHQNQFGGLLGFRYGNFSNPIHYSHLDSEFDLIEKCEPVDVQKFKPGYWNDSRDGAWHHVVDGHIVTNEEGVTTRCTQPKVDFVQWSALKDSGTKSRAIDNQNRARVPHGFASDGWADLGNIMVYRHDNGADIYEIMHFWLAQQEMNHIFSSYRRGRRDFNVWGSFYRTLARYHEKMRDSAKAIGLYVTLARDTVSHYNQGDDPADYVAFILGAIAVDNTVASTIAFDHFAHVFSRPQPGEHGLVGEGDPVLRSLDGTGFAGGGRAALNVANGVQGGFGNISLGGRPVENALDRSQGRDYNRDYTLNVGSYYEKAFTAYLLTESADNFISASRDDFVDSRFRAVSIADVFPDGYRRWLGNNLTNDEQIKGVYVMSENGSAIGPPALDGASYATLGTTSWWPQGGIETCFPRGERLTCRDPFSPINGGGPAIGQGTVVDPQIGWEQQKFAILFSLIYLTENQRVNWIDQMRIYELGTESDPGFANRIEYHDPDGRVYIAKTFGTETLYGKTVQKGIGARVLEYANELLAKGVVTTPVEHNGVTWHEPLLDDNGNVQYRKVTRDGVVLVDTCDQSAPCTKLRSYTSVPAFLRQVMGWLGYIPVGRLKGVY
jgi:hypothetical protein